MTQENGVKVTQGREEYEAPEIVPVGPAIQLTSSGGGDSTDMNATCIPVDTRPKAFDL